MEHYTLAQFGQLLQQANPDKIVSVTSEPGILLISRTEQFIETLLSKYPRPLVKPILTEEQKFPNGTLLLFNDMTREITFLSGIHRDRYLFYRSESYEELKQTLLDKAIPWSVFIKFR